VTNQDGFSLYSKVTENQYENIDEEVKYLRQLKTEDGFDVDSSKYVIIKAQCRLETANEERLEELLRNPEKERIFNEHVEELTHL